VGHGGPILFQLQECAQEQMRLRHAW
jgi:hypothetical protein